MHAVETLFASLMVLVCAVLFVRLCLGARRQQRFDWALRRAGFATRRFALRAYHWRSARKEAERVAEEAIERARKNGDWSGNVYTPKSFRGKRKPH